MRRRVVAVLLGFFTVAVTGMAAGGGTLTTEAERSGFRNTGRYAEVETLVEAFAQAYPEAVRVERFGTSPEGRPLFALAVSRTGALTADQARERGLPVLLFQGGIHAGEIDGKDAGFLALRQLLDGEAGTDALDHVVFVFVPVYNVDGHERFRAWNRPNQNGPAEMGQRATAQNYNLNRDYIKADAPETRAMLGLLQRWDPIVYIDLHATNGAKFEHDVAVQVEPLTAGDAGLADIGRDMRGELIERLTAQGSLPLPFYPSFVGRDDPTSGFRDNVYEARFSTGYYQLRNRFSVLVETHSWKDYPTRVRITRNLIVDLLDMAATDGGDWLAAAQTADVRAARLGGESLVLDWRATETARRIDFRGYAYTVTPSEVSGAPWIRYDDRRPQIWQVPLYDELVPALSVDLPTGGYLVPPTHAETVAALLDVHGVDWQRIDAPQSQRAVEVFRADTVELATGTFEGRQRASVTGQWRPESRDVPAGALFVPIAQARARLVATLFEPLGPDSLLAWGQFNPMFQRQEYVASYVAEEIARELLDDPEIAAAFAERLRSDPAFAADPQARLEFFTRRHPAWEDHWRLYPVYRSQ